MLIQTPVANNGIVTIKLIGGDEVIAKLVEDNGHFVTLSKPLLVAMAQQGFGLMPFVLTIDPDTTIDIDRSHIIVLTKTVDGVAKEYRKQTTGLIV